MYIYKCIYRYVKDDNWIISKSGYSLKMGEEISPSVGEEYLSFYFTSEVDVFQHINSQDQSFINTRVQLVMNF